MLQPNRPLTSRQIAAVWLPLAASWLLMGAEQPLLAAVIARLADPEIQLAAYGGVVFPVALVIEAPIIMLLAASTELSRDRASYQALSRFTHRTAAVLTAAHLLIAVTPLYDVVVSGLLGVPDVVAQQARPGLIVITPWTWAIASRRFHQGVLIRFGRAREVSIGTAIRLLTTSSALAIGFSVKGPGSLVAAAALSSGVIAEAIYAAFRVRSVRRALAPTSDEPPLQGRAFWAFYIPLAMTPLVTLLVMPLGTASISRMPEAVVSLAVWPVISGVAFILQAVGIAYQEVVVALVNRPGSALALRAFTGVLVVGTTAVIAALSLTPLSHVWFTYVAGLSAPLSEFAQGVFWVAIPLPAMRAIQSWYQGVLVQTRKTRGITESVVVFLVVCSAVLGTGVVTQAASGLWVMLVGFVAGRVAQTGWLAVRSAGARRALAQSQA